MINDKADEFKEELFHSLFLSIYLDCKNQYKVVIS